MTAVCLVIPCYNEGHRLKGDEILAFLRATSHLDVCFVNDGSTDDTAAIVDDLCVRGQERIRAIHLAANSGKGEAVRQGVLHVLSLQRFAFIGYWDADLSTPLLEVDHVLEAFTTYPACQLAMGSRLKRLGADIQRRAARHYLGRVFATCASVLLDLPVYDSQCGSKIFRADTARLLFEHRFVTDWLFDVEILARLRNHLGRDRALNATVEVPLNAWREVDGSKLRPQHIIRVPFELLRIGSHYNRRRS